MLAMHSVAPVETWRGRQAHLRIFGFPFPAFCICSSNQGNLTSCFPWFIYYVLRRAKENKKKSHNQIFMRFYFYFLLNIFIQEHEVIKLIIKSIENVMRSVVNEQDYKIFRREVDV
jgi:hypothetical protein